MSISKLQAISFKGDQTSVTDVKEKNTQLPKEKDSNDSFSKEQKQEIIKEAKSKSSGWGILFGILSPLYYGLRSDKKVADKFDLVCKDDEDKKLVKQIKKEQVISTIPAVVVGVTNRIIQRVLSSNKKPNANLKELPRYAKIAGLIGLGAYAIKAAVFIYNKVRPVSSIKVEDEGKPAAQQV